MPQGGAPVTPVDKQGNVIGSSSSPTTVTATGALFFTESITPPGASVTVQGAMRSSGGTAGGGGSPYSSFVAQAYCDVAGGTLYIDQTLDGGTTWRQVSSIAGVAGSAVSLKVPVLAANYRARFGNGATPQGVFQLTSGYLTN